MNEEATAKFKNLIDTAMKALSGRVIDFDVDSDGDECDEMQASVILDIAYAEKDRNTSRLNNLAEARTKLNNDEYGICEDCGENIGVKRLEICLDALYCITCAEKIEKSGR